MLSESQLKFVVSFVDQASGPMRQAATSVNQIGQAAQATATKIAALNTGLAATAVSTANTTRTLAMTGAELNMLGQRMEMVGRKMQFGLTLPLLGVGYLFTKSAGEFEQTMNVMAAAADVPASAIEPLRQQAIQLGRDTALSANQVGQAQLALVRFGFTLDKTRESMTAVSNLAQMENIEPSRAAEIIGAMINQFALDATQATHVTDILAKASQMSAASADSLASSMRYSATTAHLFGMSIEQTAAALTILSQNGIDASMAGTSLNGAMQDLINPSRIARKEIEAWHLELRKADGSFKDFGEILDEFRNKGVTQGGIFRIFDTQSARAMIPLITGGSAALKQFTAELEKSDGTSQKMGNAMMSGLVGQMRQLSGAVESLMIVVGQSGILTKVTGMIAGLADFTAKLGKLPQQLLFGGAAFLAFLAILGPVIAALGTAATAISGVMAVAASPVGLVAMGTALAAAGLALEAFRLKNKQVEGDVATVADHVGAAWDKAADHIGAALDRAGIKMEKFWAGFKQGFLDGIHDVEEGAAKIAIFLADLIPGAKEEAERRALDRADKAQALKLLNDQRLRNGLKPLEDLDADVRTRGRHAGDAGFRMMTGRTAGKAGASFGGADGTKVGDPQSVAPGDSRVHGRGATDEQQAADAIKKWNDEAQKRIAAMTETKRQQDLLSGAQAYGIKEAIAAAGADREAALAKSALGKKIIEVVNAEQAARDAKRISELSDQVYETQERAKIAAMYGEQQAIASALLDDRIRRARENNVALSEEKEATGALRDKIIELALAQEKAKDAAQTFHASFKRSLDEMWEKAKNVGGQVSDILSRGIGGAVDNITAMLMGQKADWKEWARTIIAEILKVIVQLLVLKAVKAAASFFGFSSGGTFGDNRTGLALNANGGMYGAAQRFADGSAFANKVVNSPTFFRFANGAKLGVMGEAGPEAIMPLKRMSNGKLGVQTAGGGGATVFSPQINVTVQGSTGNQQSDAEYAKQIAYVVEKVVDKKLVDFQNTQLRSRNHAGYGRG